MEKRNISVRETLIGCLLHVAGLRIKLVIVWLWNDTPTNRATPARAPCFILNNNILSVPLVYHLYLFLKRM